MASDLRGGKNFCYRDGAFQIRTLILFKGAKEVILSNERFLPSSEKRNRTLSNVKDFSVCFIFHSGYLTRTPAGNKTIFHY